VFFCVAFMPLIGTAALFAIARKQYHEVRSSLPDFDHRSLL